MVQISHFPLTTAIEAIICFEDTGVDIRAGIAQHHRAIRVGRHIPGMLHVVANAVAAGLGVNRLKPLVQIAVVKAPVEFITLRS